MANQGYELPKFDMSMMPMSMMPMMKPADAEAVMAAQRRNLEAMTNAGQILADGARSFAQRQSEMVQARMSDFNAKAGHYMKPQQADATAVEGQLAEAKSAYQQTVSDTRELMEIVTKAQADALRVVNQCVLSNLDEMKKLTA